MAKRKRQNRMRLYAWIFSGFLAVIALYVFWNFSFSSKALEASALQALMGKDAPQTEMKDTLKENEPKVRTDGAGKEDERISFVAPTLLAEAAIVMDAKTGEVLFEKNAHTQFPLASITKVMSALVAQNIYDDGQTIEIENIPLKVYGNDGLAQGQRYTFEDLLDFSLVTSSNDGISVISYEAFPQEGNTIFVKNMNEKAHDLGLSQSFYLNPTGLDSSKSISGGYGSALDVATLFRYVESTYPGLLDATTNKEVSVSTVNGKSIVGRNTNEIVYAIPSLIASKTGYTELAGGTLAVMYNAGLDHPVVIVVLQSTREGRFQDMKKLIEATASAFGSIYYSSSY